MRILPPSMILSLLVLASSIGAAHSQNCLWRNTSAVGLTASPPACAAFTPSYTATLRANYNPASRVSLGVIGAFGKYVPGNPATIVVTGKGNNDHLAYANCCSQCSTNPSCSMYSLQINSIRNQPDGNRTVHYRCNLYMQGCISTAAPRFSTDGVDTFYPAAFARPGPACSDDAPISQVISCPSQWTFIKPDEDGEVSPQFQGATADNFQALGGSAIVKGRLVSSNSLWLEIPNLTAQQCVSRTWNKDGDDNVGEYFTWESCSKTCKIFNGNVCNGMNGVVTGFTPSTTAFSGKFPPRG